jgi:hypothetical protein
MENREQLLAAGMLEPASRAVAGIILRPFSLGSMQACYMLDLSIYTDSTERKRSDAETQRQVITFAWMHAVPETEVIDAICRNRVTEEVFKFSFSIPFDAVEQLYEETQRIADMIAASSVRVESKTSPTKAEEPPGKS